MIRRYLPRSTEELIHWYERFVAPFALIGGFLLDTFIFLDRVDSLGGNLFLLSYLLIAMTGIALLNLVESGRVRSRIMLAIAPFIAVVVQFTFGGLFSGYVSLYSRSASLAVSWIFVLVAAGLLIGNERFRRYYVRFTFQISILFICIFSFLIFFLPVLFKYIGPWIFIASGLASLCIVALFLYCMHLLVPELERKERTSVAWSIAGIFIVFNILYFTNAIPPLPLALKDAGIYHSVLRTGDSYVLSTEPLPWYRRLLLLYNTRLRLSEGESAYAFSAVFAPSDLQTTILHEWQRFDEGEERWITEGVIPFRITGGRDGGYRGYSIKNSLAAGKWRVNVLTEYGHVVGRIAFSVVRTGGPVDLVEIVR